MGRKPKNGEGTAQLRKDGLPKTKNVLARTKGECAAKLKALKESLKGAEPERPKGDMTFGTWLDRWYQRDCKPAIKPKTQADYENRIYLQIRPRFGQICHLGSV